MTQLTQYDDGTSGWGCFSGPVIVALCHPADQTHFLEPALETWQPDLK